MINLDKQTLKQLQKAELELLTEFDRICRKNNIKYSLTGGTLLGAVRHGVFIPWDDDVDVAMLRSEYEKFKKALASDLNNNLFYFQDIQATPGYRWGYGKLRKKNTIFLRENQEHMPYEQGIFMDIFPRDGVPDGKISRAIHVFFCFCIRKILWSAVGRFSDKRRPMRIWFTFIYYLFGNTIYKLYNLLVKISNRRPDTQLVRALTFPVPRKFSGYKREWYKEYEDIQFEKKFFMVEKGYLSWLEQEFGDYMKLPPLEKRKIHPVVEIKI